MAKRRGRKRLEPPLPEVKDELNLPRYFGIIKGSGFNKAKEERRERMPGMMPTANEIPRSLRSGHSFSPGEILPDLKPEHERVPLVIRAARRFLSALKIEPERPVRMPRVPELRYPPLYTRYPIMKTVTKTTDVNGEIEVTYSHLFQTIPGVVITVKDPDNVFGTVFETTLTNFKVRLFKMDHNHGGVVDDDGKHTPTINADGNHSHQVTGSLSWMENSKYGRLVLANNTDYEKDHVHDGGPGLMTGYEGGAFAHTHVNYATDYESSHTHGFSDTSGAPSSTDYALDDLDLGCECSEACGGGYCVTGAPGGYVASSTHTHYVSGTTGGGSSHRHTQGKTGTGTNHRHSMGTTGTQPGDGHRHLISNDELYAHYMTGISDVSLDLLVTAYEDPYHGHSAVEVAVHGHGVAADGRVLLVSTNVTLTYMAQEESS